MRAHAPETLMSAREMCAVGSRRARRYKYLTKVLRFGSISPRDYLFFLLSDETTSPPRVGAIVVRFSLFFPSHELIFKTK